MGLLILGLVLFLGVHSIRIFAADWRQQQIENRGPGLWKGIYSLVSIVGLVVLVFGYASARETAGLVYEAPSWGRSVLFVAMPVALVLFVASQFPPGHLKKRFQHPMVWSLIIWSCGHLLANGDAASVLMFGAFLIWSVLDLMSAYRRPRPEPVPALVWPDLASLAIGFGLVGALTVFLHEWLTGVPIT